MTDVTPPFWYTRPSKSVIEFPPLHTYSLPPLPYHIFRYPDYSIPVSLAYQVVPLSELDASEEDPIRLVFLCLKPAPKDSPWGPWPLPVTEAARKVRRNFAKIMFATKAENGFASPVVNVNEQQLIDEYVNMTDEEYFSKQYDKMEADGTVSHQHLKHDERLLSIDIEGAIRVDQITVKPVLYNDCPRALRDFQTWVFDQYMDLLRPLDCCEETCARAFCSQVFCAELGCPLSLCAYHASTLLWGSAPGIEIKFQGAIWLARCCGCHEEAVWDNVKTKAASSKFYGKSSMIPMLLGEFGPQRHIALYKARPTVVLTITATTDLNITETLNSSLFVTQWLGCRNFNLILINWKLYSNTSLQSNHFQDICSQLRTLTYSQVVVFFVQHRHISGVTSMGKGKDGQDLHNIDALSHISEAVLDRDPRIELHGIMVTCQLLEHTLASYLQKLPAFQSFTGFLNTLPVEQGILYCSSAFKNWFNLYSQTFLTQALINNTTQAHVADLRPMHCVRLSNMDTSSIFCLTPQGLPCDSLSTTQTSLSEHKSVMSFLGLQIDAKRRTNVNTREPANVKRSKLNTSSSSSAVHVLSTHHHNQSSSSSSSTPANCNLIKHMHTFPGCFEKEKIILSVTNDAWIQRQSLRNQFNCKELFNHILFLYSRYREKGGIIHILRYCLRQQLQMTATTADSTSYSSYSTSDITYQALCMVDQYLAQQLFLKSDTMYLSDALMVEESVKICRWGHQNEKSWYRGNQLLQSLGAYIHGSQFLLTTIKGKQVLDDTPR